MRKRFLEEEEEEEEEEEIVIFDFAMRFFFFFFVVRWLVGGGEGTDPQDECAVVFTGQQLVRAAEDVRLPFGHLGEHSRSRHFPLSFLPL